MCREGVLNGKGVLKGETEAWEQCMEKGSTMGKLRYRMHREGAKNGETEPHKQCMERGSSVGKLRHRECMEKGSPMEKLRHRDSTRRRGAQEAEQRKYVRAGPDTP